MVIVKLKPEVKKKTPFQRVLEIEESLITDPKELRKYYYDFLRQYLDPKLPRITQLKAFRQLVIDISSVIDIQENDLKELLANHMVRRKAFELFKTELKRDENVVIIAGSSKQKMEDSMAILANIANARKDGITIDESELNVELVNPE